MQRLNRQGIASFAERVGIDNDLYKTDEPPDVRALVARLGGTIELSHDEESLAVHSDGSFTIFVPFTTSPRRDTFTIAHELGHYFLHHQLPKYLDPTAAPQTSFNRGGIGNLEAEANLFAASLLMPREAFIQAHEQSQGDIDQLAYRFGVSPAAARVRASSLGLL